MNKLLPLFIRFSLINLLYNKLTKVSCQTPQAPSVPVLGEGPCGDFLITNAWASFEISPSATSIEKDSTKN